MSEFDVDPDTPLYTDEERALLKEKVSIGVPPDLKARIPDAPDISKPPKAGVPGTFKNSIAGLEKLRPDEIPEVGKHFVIWGSAHLDDIQPRRVRRTICWTEDTHADRERAHTQLLIDRGLKNPKTWTDPKTGRPGLTPDTKGVELWDRMKRTEHYARWRYKGYVCGEVASL